MLVATFPNYNVSKYVIDLFSEKVEDGADAAQAEELLRRFNVFVLLSHPICLFLYG